MGVTCVFVVFSTGLYVYESTCMCPPKYVYTHCTGNKIILHKALVTYRLITEIIQADYSTFSV